MLCRFSFIAPCLLEAGVMPKKNETPIKTLRTTERNFYDEYELHDLLGAGTYSAVRLATHKKTGQQFAVKVQYFS